MLISTLSIENFKCYHERQEFNFEKGFNLLVGVNNAGKTAALALLDRGDAVHDPHREFSKTKDFPVMVEWVLQHDKKPLAELFRSLRELFGLPEATTG